MRLALVVSLVLISLGCAVKRTPMIVEVASDQELSQQRFWEWDGPKGPAEAELDAAIRVAIERELAARGLYRSDGQWPELRVSYGLALQREIQIRTETPSSQYLSSHSNVTQSYEVTASEQVVRVFETGSLLVRVDLPGERKPAWQAVQATRVSGSLAPHVAESVALLFESFPARHWTSPLLEATAPPRPPPLLADQHP